jgi:hypothetical protein
MPMPAAVKGRIRPDKLDSPIGAYTSPVGANIAVGLIPYPCTVKEP